MKIIKVLRHNKRSGWQVSITECGDLVLHNGDINNMTTYTAYAKDTPENRERMISEYKFNVTMGF